MMRSARFRACEVAPPARFELAPLPPEGGRTAFSDAEEALLPRDFGLLG